MINFLISEYRKKFFPMLKTFRGSFSQMRPRSISFQTTFNFMVMRAIKMKEIAFPTNSTLKKKSDW